MRRIASALSTFYTQEAGTSSPVYESTYTNMSFNRHVYFDGNPLINPSTLIPNDRFLAIYRQIADDVASENITAGRVGTTADFYAFQEIPHRMHTAISAEEDRIGERAGASMASNSSTRPDDALGTSRGSGMERGMGSTCKFYQYSNMSL
jgi:hypothetical protein